MTREELLDDLIVNTGAVKIVGLRVIETYTFNSETTTREQVIFADNTLGYYTLNRIEILVIDNGITTDAYYLGRGYQLSKKSFTELILDRKDQLIAAGIIYGLEILSKDDVGEVAIVKAYFPGNNPNNEPISARYILSLDSNRNIVQKPATAKDAEIINNLP